MENFVSVRHNERENVFLFSLVDVTAVVFFFFPFSPFNFGAVIEVASEPITTGLKTNQLAVKIVKKKRIRRGGKKKKAYGVFVKIKFQYLRNEIFSLSLFRM